MRHGGSRAAWAAVAVAIAVATGPPAAAFAQSTSRSPSAEGLWQRYPLDEAQKGGEGRRDAGPTSRGAAQAKAPAASGGGMPWVAVAAGLAALALLSACGLAVRRRRGRQASVRAQAAPPGPSGSWNAVIEWADGGAPRFRAVARSAEAGAEVAVAETPRLEWPPTNDVSVRALADEAERLERRLVAAGWKPAGADTAWYAKRFAWEPEHPSHRRAAVGRRDALAAWWYGAVVARAGRRRYALAAWWYDAVVVRATRRRYALAAWWYDAVVGRAGAWRDAVAARRDEAVVDRLAGWREEPARAPNAARVLTIALLVGVVAACIVVAAALA